MQSVIEWSMHDIIAIAYLHGPDILVSVTDRPHDHPGTLPFWSSAALSWLRQLQRPKLHRILLGQHRSWLTAQMVELDIKKYGIAHSILSRTFRSYVDGVGAMV